MATGILCLAIFLVMASLMYTRRISALLALPLMAIAISLAGSGLDKAGCDFLMKDVLAKGSLKMHNAYTTTMFGAMLAELMNKHGMARALVRWVAEFAGDSPYLLGLAMTLVTALLFSSLGGLGAVIMVGTIILPVMLSLGIPSLACAGLFLFGISLGGMFNLTNWQLYTDVLGIDKSLILSFVAPFSLIMAFVVLLFLFIELKQKSNLKYFALGTLVLALAYPWLSSIDPRTQNTESDLGLSYIIALVMIVVSAGYAIMRQIKADGSASPLLGVPGFALITPLIPLMFVLVFRWEIIPAFMLGIAYGVLTTWRRDSINILTRSIIDGVNNVVPAVLLMVGIGMLITSVMNENVSQAIAPIIKAIVPTTAIAYVVVFTVIAPLALYRGPLSLWGMGSGLVTLVAKVTSLSSQAIMGMLMSVGQIQGICDPTNTQNIWVAAYLGVDTQAILKKTLPVAWLLVLAGLCLAIARGFVAF
jgi:DcuC family C4-dicarboxylate transporter